MIKKNKFTFEEFPRINPECKYVVWMVKTSQNSTTNPMTKRQAISLIKDRISPKYDKHGIMSRKGQYATLIKAWSCVQAKNFT